MDEFITWKSLRQMVKYPLNMEISRTSRYLQLLVQGKWGVVAENMEHKIITHLKNNLRIVFKGVKINHKENSLLVMMGAVLLLRI